MYRTVFELIRKNASIGQIFGEDTFTCHRCGINMHALATAAKFGERALLTDLHIE